VALSVVMPVHNAAPFLSESISSILTQSFRDFEFIILDDASTDGSRTILCDWARRDSRIRVIFSPERLGLAASSNRVLAYARGATVARMDADDVSHPARLERQCHVLASQPDVVLVGALAEGIDRDGRHVRPRDRWRIVRRSPYIPFPHGSIMFRREIFERIGGYSAGAEGAEDQDLVHRMRALGRVVTLPDVLYRYRYHTANASIALKDVPAVDWGRLPSDTGHASRSYTRGAMRLWAGDPPDVLRDIASPSARSWHPRYAMILAWAVWSEIHPRSLRHFLYMLAVVRDRLCGLRLRDGVTYEWRSGRS
jgi:glycosyltransferase involved in cell wall biosynthesis